MELYKDHLDNHHANAQRNLMGRTHFVDPDTLKFHHSRIISSHVIDNGLLFAIVTRDAANWENTKKEYRYTIFDLFGTVVETCPRVDGVRVGFNRLETCRKAMWNAINLLDAHELTLQASVAAQSHFIKDMVQLRETVRALRKSKAA